MTDRHLPVVSEEIFLQVCGETTDENLSDEEHTRRIVMQLLDEQPFLGELVKMTVFFLLFEEEDPDTARMFAIFAIKMYEMLKRQAKLDSALRDSRS